METSKFKTKPYKHQLECLNKYGRKEYFALLAEMGTGKTWIIINNAAELWESGDCDSMIVFAPNGVHSNWTRLEIPKHMPEWVNYHCAPWSSNPKKEDKERLDGLFKPINSNKLRILCMNWEALQTKRGLEFAKKFALCCRSLMIVCDESDAIKNPSAQRTKSLMKLKNYSRFRRIMSGSPITNSPFDAFSQFNFLDESILQTTSFYSFKSEYAELLQEGSPLLNAIKAKSGLSFTPAIIEKDFNGRPKFKNLDKLSKIIMPHSFRVLKKDCLDLPEKIYKTVLFDLTAKQQKIYDKAKFEFRLVLKEDESTFHKIASFTKLSQITSGYYIHPASNTPVKIEGKNPKLDVLCERVRKILNAEGKIIIWAKYRMEINDIVLALKEHARDIVQYHGGIDKEERIKAIDKFENGSAKIFVGNQQSGGTGITLTSANYVIYFSNSFSLRDRIQSEDRAHRIGQTKRVTYINIAAKDTIDEIIINSLINKKDIADIIIDVERGNIVL